MKAEDIAEALNMELHAQLTRMGLPAKGFFVVHKKIEVHQSFKMLKTFQLTLWFVINRKKYPITTNQLSERVITGQEERIFPKLSVLMLQGIFGLLSNKTIVKVLEEMHGISFNE